MRSISPEKIRWALIISMSVLLIAVTSIPYLYGFLARPDGHAYSGIDYLAPGDTNTYFAMIEEVKQGNVSFHNLFTSEDHPKAYVNVLWLAVGLLAKVLSLSPLVAFHVARVLLIPVLVYVVARVLYYFFGDRHTKVALGMGAILLASGMGIFIDGFLNNPPFSVQHPVDLWVTEAIPFLSIMHSPHFIASILFLLLTLFWIMRSFIEQKYSYAVFAGVCGAILFSMHPFYVPTVYAVAGVWGISLLLINLKKYKRVLTLSVVFFALSAPVLLYFLWMNSLSLVFHEWSAANQLHSPNPWMYLIGFGFLIPFAVYGAYRTWADIKFRLVTYWVIVNGILLYAPFSFQRRLVEGLQIPLGILAAVGIWHVFQKASRRSWHLAVACGACLIVFFPLGNLQMISQDMYLYSNSDSMFYHLYFPKQSDLEGMAWLKEQTDESDIILSSKELGNFIPAYSGRRVFIGHRPQTLFYDLKMSLVDNFFMAPENKKTFLQDWGITYVFYSSQDQQLHDYLPPTASFLSEVYANDGTKIYEVTYSESMTD